MCSNRVTIPAIAALVVFMALHSSLEGALSLPCDVYNGTLIIPRNGTLPPSPVNGTASSAEQQLHLNSSTVTLFNMTFDGSEALSYGAPDGKEIDGVFLTPNSTRTLVMREMQVSNYFQVVVDLTEILAHSMLCAAQRQKLSNDTRQAQVAGKSLLNDDVVSIQIVENNFNTYSSIVVYADEEAAAAKAAQLLEEHPFNISGNFTKGTGSTTNSSITIEETPKSEFFSKMLSPAAVIFNFSKNTVNNGKLMVGKWKLRRCKTALLLIEANDFSTSGIATKSLRRYQSGHAELDGDDKALTQFGIGEFEVEGKQSGIGIVKNRFYCMRLTTGAKCWNVFFAASVTLHQSSFYVNDNAITSICQSICRPIQVRNGGMKLFAGAFFTFGPNNKMDIVCMSGDCAAINFNNAPVHLNQSNFRFFKNSFNANCNNLDIWIVRFVKQSQPSHTIVSPGSTLHVKDNFALMRTSPSNTRNFFQYSEDGRAYFEPNSSVVFAGNEINCTNGAHLFREFPYPHRLWFVEPNASVTSRCNYINGVVVNVANQFPDIQTHPYPVEDVTDCTDCSITVDCISEQSATDVQYQVVNASTGAQECVCQCAPGTAPPLCTTGVAFPLPSPPNLTFAVDPVYTYSHSASITHSVEQALASSGRYKIFSSRIVNTIDEANHLCESTGGWLASVATPTDHQHVGNLIAATNLFPLIGGTDEAQEGIWVWKYGRRAGQVFYKHSGRQCLQDICPWRTGEPNNQAGGSEHYLAYYMTTTGWNDWPLPRDLPICCEYPDTTSKSVSVTEALPAFAAATRRYRRYPPPQDGRMSRTWYEAASHCLYHGGWLATIMSEKDQREVESILNGNSVWIGGSDVENETEWKWMFGPKNGSVISVGAGVPATNTSNASSSNVCQQAFCNWDERGEPNSASNNDPRFKLQDFLRMRGNGKWVSANQREELTNNAGAGNVGYICEFDAATQTKSNTVILPTAVAVSKNYKLFVPNATNPDENWSWQQAEAYCEFMGGWLATVRSLRDQQEAFSLVDQFSPFNVWLGGSDADTEGTFHWMSGPFAGRIVSDANNTCQQEFCNWATGEPNNGGSGQHFMKMYRSTGKWDDDRSPTSGYNGFLCEFGPGHDTATRVPTGTATPSAGTASPSLTEERPPPTNTPLPTATIELPPPLNATASTTRSVMPATPAPPPKKSIAQLRETPVPCPALQVPLTLETSASDAATKTVLPQGTLLTDAAGSNVNINLHQPLVFVTTAKDIRSTGVVLQVSLRSCHQFNSTFAISSYANSSVSSGGHSMSLVSINKVDGAAVQQSVIGGGRVVKISIGPIETYFPPDDDGVVFVDNKGERGGMFDPRPQISSSSNVATTTTASSSSSYGSPYFGALPPMALIVTAEKKPQPNPTTAVVVSGGSSSIGVAGAALGNPAMAGAAQRQALLSNVAECPRSVETEPLSQEVHPLGFPIGSSPFKYYQGSIVGNTALIIAMFVIHFLIALLVSFWKKISLALAIEWARFPSRSIPIATILMQGVISSSLMVVLSGTETVAVVGSIVATAAVIVLCLVVTVTLSKKQHSGFDSKYTPKDMEGRSFLAWITMNVGRWVPRNPAREGFVRMYGPLFEEFFPHSKGFFLLDLLVMIVSSYIMALIPNNAARCDIVFASVVGLFILYAAVLVATRPFLAGINNFLFGSTAVCQAASAICLYIAYGRNSEIIMSASEFLNMAVVFLQFINMLFSLGKTIQDWRNDDLQPDKAIRQESELEAARDVEKMLKLQFAFLSVVPLAPQEPQSPTAQK